MSYVAYAEIHACVRVCEATVSAWHQGSCCASSSGRSSNYTCGQFRIQDAQLRRRDAGVRYVLCLVIGYHYQLRRYVLSYESSSIMVKLRVASTRLMLWLDMRERKPSRNRSSRVVANYSRVLYMSAERRILVVIKLFERWAEYN